MEQDVFEALRRITPRTYLRTLVVNICDHCNLNCCGCDHFSPIAEERFYEASDIERDLKQIHNIIGDSVEKISIMGGEPLLHPQLIKIIDAARSIFKDTAIWLSTNGTLLNKIKEEDWERLREDKVLINVTKYPIDFDYDEVCEKAKEMKVDFQYYQGGTVEKTMGHYPLDISGSQDPTESFIRCYHANYSCNMLQKGRLYTCTVAPCMPIFSKKFNLDINLTDDDGIDIFKVTDKRELFRRLAEPMPACRFCDVKNRTYEHQWKTSTGDMSEWT